MKKKKTLSIKQVRGKKDNIPADVNVGETDISEKTFLCRSSQWGFIP